MKLTLKIVIGFVTLIVLMGVVNNYTTSYVLENLQEERLKTAEVVFAKSLAKRLYRAIIDVKISRITNVLFDEKSIREDKVEYILVFDNKGYLLAHTYLGDMPKVLIKSHDHFSRGKDYIMKEINDKELSVYDIAVPVMEGIRNVGAIHVGIRSDYVKNIITPTRSASDMSLIITLAVGIIAVFVIIPVSRNITGPLRKLKKQSEEISRGTLNARIDIESSDEIGDLAKAFNNMAEALNSTTVSKGYMDNVFRSMNDALIVIDTEGTIKTANRAVLDMLKYEENEVVGRPVQKIFADNPLVSGPGTAPLVTDGYTTDRETYYLNKYGKKVPVLFSSSVMRDHDNSVIGVVCVAQDITERTKAEQKMKESEERFRALYESANDAILTISCAEGRIPWFTDCNSRALETFACQRETIVGKTPVDFSPQMQPDGEMSEVQYPHLALSAMEDMPQTFEWTHCRADGTVFPAEVSLKRFDIRDKTYLQAVVRDITERKWMEDSLVESEEYARSFIDSSQDSVCNITSDGQLMSMNRTGYILYGFDESEDITGIDFCENIVENRKVLEEAISQASEGENVSAQFMSRSQNGKEVWWDAKLTPLVDLDGSIKSIMVVSRDVTENKEMEKSLRDAQSLLLKEHNELTRLFKQVEQGKQEWEDTMNCMGDMVILTDNEGKIKRINKAFQAFVGRPNREIIGHDWEELTVESGLETSTFYAGSIEMLHKTSHRWFALSSYPIKDTNNELIGVVITIHETTEIKKITEELEKAYAELKASQSTALQREKMASIGQLAAGVAHEINNPMGFITSNLGTLNKYVKKLTGFIEAQSEAVKASGAEEIILELEAMHKKLKLGYVLDDIEDLIRESEDGADRVTKIVKNLKSFSRVDQAECKSVDINECIESTLNIVWNELKYKATLEKDYGELPYTKCYPQQLNQVFVNILVNSAQAIEKQGNISIRTWNGDGAVNISISDTGSGIPEDKVNRIFEPFFTTKEVGKGTGLGLSICYDIIKKHNGDITVESELGKGTTFNIRLPVIKE